MAWRSRSGVVLSLAAAFLPVFTDSLLSSEAIAETRVMQDEYIVKRGKIPAGAAVNAASIYDVVNKSQFIDVVRPRRGSNFAAPSGPTKEIVAYNKAEADAVCAEIMKDPSIEYCEPNYTRTQDAFPNGTFPNDPGFYPNIPTWQGQFAHYAQYGDGVTAFDMRTPYGWDYSVGSDTTVVGIVDSGINYNHADLSPNLWQNPNEAFNGIDDDGNGYIDDIIGVDANYGGNDPSDCNGHGSHVAGIIGARGNNGYGIAGVAWRVKMIMARNAIDCSPSVSVAAAVRGIEYFYDLKKNRGINVAAVNASYSGNGRSQAEYDAISKLGDVNIVFVAAAGNDGINIDTDPRWPAAHDLPNLISVANINNFNVPSAIADSSNFGTTSVDIGAPGSEINSTIEPDQFEINRFGVKSGTSMAAPAVVGAIAVLVSQRPYFIGYQTIINHIYTNSTSVSFLNGLVKFPKILDLQKLLSAADPTDGCPNDSAKIEPGYCGCGKPEVYTDSDNDRTPDCADLCPGDGVKGAPGNCGCGVADSDFNANAVADCIDATLAGETPPKPAVKVKNRKLTVTMGAVRAGAQYLVEIQTKAPGKKKFKKKSVVSASPVYTQKAPAKGAVVKIAYFFHIPGAQSSVTSQKSPGVSKTMK